MTPECKLHEDNINLKLTGIAESFYKTDSSQVNFHSQFAIPSVTEVNKISISAQGIRTLRSGTKIEIYRI